MGVKLGFDASKVTPSVALEPVPSGWYVAMFVESTMVPTNDQKGSYLEMVGEIAEGPYKGRKFWDRLNLQNANPTAVEIAYERLSAICHATGVIQVDDSSMLHNKPLQVKLSARPAGIGKDNQPYDATNEVKGYKAVEGAVAGAVGSATAPVIPPTAGGAAPTQQAATATTAAPAAEAATPPWAKKDPVSETASPTPPWAQGAPAAPASAPVPPPAEPKKTMTAKAAGATYEQFIANKWTDEMMVKEGYLIIE